jgi:SNF2 family DNA or RNA helicase
VLVPKVSLSSVDPSRLVIDTQFADRYQIKQLPGSRFKDGQWNAPLSWASCVILRELFGTDLEIDQQVYDWAAAEQQRRITPALSWRERTDADDWSPRLALADAGLRPFQRAGIRFLAAAGSGFLAEPMGSGKTAQVIRTMMLLHEMGNADLWPLLVVCPNSIKLTWKREFARWWPEIDVAVVNGSIAERRRILDEPHQVYVINYEGLRSHSRLAPYGAVRLRRCHVCDHELPEKLNPQHRCEWCPKELNTMEFGTFVLDEAHRIKNPLAKQTRAVWQVGKRANRRYALTGTPVGDTPDDMWPIMHLVDSNEHPDRGRYIEFFCLAGFNYFGAVEIMGLRPDHREAFFKIIDPRFRRLPKELILPQLPPVIKTTRELSMGTRQEKAYRSMERHMAALLDTELLIAPNPLTKLIRLMQFASACGEINEVEAKVWQHCPRFGHNGRVSLLKCFHDGPHLQDKHQIIEQRSRVDLIEPSNKIEAMHDVLDELGEAPLVVASESKKMARLALESLKRRGISCDIISGDQDVYQRNAAEQDFQSGRTRVLVCVVAAAGEGLTLTRAGHLLWINRSWSMIKTKQMEDRVHRIGSEIHDTVEIIDLVSVGTVEYRLLDVLAGKFERLEEIVRDRDTMRRILGVK